MKYRIELSSHDRRSPIVSALIAVALIALTVLGCGKLPEGNARVTGEIRLHTGETLKNVEGVVRFDPEELYSGGDRGASIGWLNTDGSFTIMTQASGDGVPVGEYRVVLVVRGRDDSIPGPVHFDYKHFETTPWRVTVKPAQSNHFELVLDDVSKRPLLEHDLPDHDY